MNISKCSEIKMSKCSNKLVQSTDCEKMIIGYAQVSSKEKILISNKFFHVIGLKRVSKLHSVKVDMSIGL